MASYELSYGGIAIDAVKDDERALIASKRFDYVFPFLSRPPSVGGSPNLFSRFPLADFPDQPMLTAGRFFYPTHASRWAWYIGCVRQSQLDRIQEQISGSQPTSLPFVMQADDKTHTDNSGGVTTNLFMLPPRPLGVTDSTLPREPLYLLTLVDDRYLWTFKSVPKLHAAELASWELMLTAIEEALEISVEHDAFESVYLAPEPDSSLYTNYENAGQLLDAIGWNTGRTLVRAYDGSYSLVKTSDAAELATANRPPSPRYRAFGGDIYDPQEQGVTKAWINAALPESVQVTFPKFNNTVGYYIDPDRSSYWVRESYGEVYTVTITLAALGSPYSSYVGFSASKTIQDTCKALLTTDDAVTPTNLSVLTALATQLAKDYYDYQLAALDEAYNGVRDWSPDPLNDIIIDHLPPGLVQTRVARKPWDFQVYQMQHQAVGVNPDPVDGDCCVFVARITGGPALLDNLAITVPDGIILTGDNTIYNVPSDVFDDLRVGMLFIMEDSGNAVFPFGTTIAQLAPSLNLIRVTEDSGINSTLPWTATPYGYSWIKQKFSTITGEPSDDPSLVGTLTSNPASELNGNSAPAGIQVFMEYRCHSDGTDVYQFSYKPDSAGSTSQTSVVNITYEGNTDFPTYIFYGTGVYVTFLSTMHVGACLIMAGAPASVYEPTNPPLVTLSSPGETDGEWNAGTYYCKITFVDSTGAEGFVSPESAQFTLTGRVTSGGDGRYPIVDMNNTPPADIVSWRVYFTPTNGAVDSEVGPSPATVGGGTTIYDLPVGTTTVPFKTQNYGTDPHPPPTAAASTGGSGTQPWSCFLMPTCCDEPTWTGLQGEVNMDLCATACGNPYPQMWVNMDGSMTWLPIIGTGTEGDMIVGGADGGAEILCVGTEGQVARVSSTNTVVWDGSGYNASVEQVLTHDASGNFVWEDVEECP